jgi:ABC-type Zn uptake system ZnuABC Zn-binding protein ZnuA
MTPRRLIALTVALAAAGLAACGDGAGAGKSGGPPVVVATTTQVGDLARQVAGERATVRQILQPNSDPHEYEPRPSDVKAVSGAAVVLRSGGAVDAWLTSVLENAGSDTRAVTLSDGLRPRRLDRETDPHWWQNPRNAIVAVTKIRAALTAADPGGRDAYAANANAYLARLRALDAAVASCIAKVPARERLLVTDHDALGYYADRYAIRVIGTVIPALSTQAQASAGEVARLVRTIRAAGVTTIFSENSVSSRLTRAIARDAGARVGPALYADTLGAKATAGATYIGSIEANTRALVAGFSDGRVRCSL